MSKEPKEKIYLNGIPVYRTVEDDGDKVYVLFEDDMERGHVLRISPEASRDDEYGIVLGQILKLIRPTVEAVKNGQDFEVRVEIQEYEQSKRDKQWIQKPS